jgi:hypothetical protein
MLSPERCEWELASRMTRSAADEGARKPGATLTAEESAQHVQMTETVMVSQVNSSDGTAGL